MEIVVSLFLLALLSLALIPLLTQGLTQTSMVSTRTAANQFLSAQMEVLQLPTPTPICGTGETEGAVDTMTDSQGVELSAIRTVQPCPTPPGSFLVEVEVRRTDTDGLLASASTRLYH